MKYRFSSALLVGLFFVISFLSSAQCPTTGVPANVPKSKFDFAYNNITTLVDGTNSSFTPTVCAGTRFSFVDKSNLTGVTIRYYFYQPANNSLPPIGLFNSRSPITVPLTSGRYVLLQIAVDASNAIKAYNCLPIEVKAMPTPNFTVSSCKSQEITLGIPAHTNNIYDSYNVNWGDGTPVEIVAKSQIPFTKVHSYTNATPKTISITGKNTNEICEGFVQQTVQTNGNNTFTPTLTSITITDDATNEIRYIGGNYTFDFLEKQGNGSYKSVKTVANPGNGTVSQKVVATKATENQYCYKISATDVCNRVKESADELCSLPLKVTPLQKKNLLKWATITHPRFTQYRFLAGGRNQTTTKADNNTFMDSLNIRCIDYTYQVIPQIGTMTSISNVSTVRGMDTTRPAAIVNALATIEKGKVNLQIAGVQTGQNIKNFEFYHIENNKPVSLYKGSGNRVIDEKSNPTVQKQCYQVAFENSCGVQSKPSELFCPVFLQPSSTGLEWTEYQKFQQGLSSYFVEKLANNGLPTGLSTKVDKKLTYDLDPTTFDPNEPSIKYRIRAESVNRQISYSNEIDYSQRLILYVPTAFTPNGDTINDLFEIRGVAVKLFSMTIIDRFGKSIFETTDMKTSWDGTFNGEPVPVGMYSYDIRATDFKGETTRKTGQLYLLR